MEVGKSGIWHWNARDRRASVNCASGPRPGVSEQQTHTVYKARMSTAHQQELVFTETFGAIPETI